MSETRPVIITFDHYNPENVGRTFELPVGDAQMKVAEGRARWADTDRHDANDYRAAPVPAEEPTPAPAVAAVTEDAKATRRAVKD